MTTSPLAHVYRLILVLALALAAFLGIKALAVPDTWDSDKWYRRAAEQELKAQPLQFGGNQSCLESNCHEDDRQENHGFRYQALSTGNHQGLACEGCHGLITEHVKVVDAV